VGLDRKAQEGKGAGEGHAKSVAGEASRLTRPTAAGR
jgi:hypothetical protein